MAGEVEEVVAVVMAVGKGAGLVVVAAPWAQVALPPRAPGCMWQRLGLQHHACSGTHVGMPSVCVIAIVW